jgi:hypothetical protein
MMKNKIKTITITLITACLLFGCSNQSITDSTNSLISDDYVITAARQTNPPPLAQEHGQLLTFQSIDELLELREKITLNDEEFQAYMAEFRNFIHGINSKPAIEEFFQLMDNSYIPVDTGWWNLTYDPSFKTLCVMYHSDIGMRISIDLNESQPFNSREYLQKYESIKGYAEVTSELMPFRHTDSDSVESGRMENNGFQLRNPDMRILRIENDTRVYQRELGEAEIEMDRQAGMHRKSAFDFNVNGFHVFVAIANAPDEAAEYEILANLEFAKGVFNTERVQRGVD